MIGLYRDPHGKTLFKGHTIRSSSKLWNPHMVQIENLRRRVRELESLINQLQSSTVTESSREKETQMESCSDKGTSDELRGEEPIAVNGVESIERPHPEMKVAWNNE